MVNGKGSLTLVVLPEQYVVSRLSSVVSAPQQVEFWSLSVTADEISLVCKAADVPANVTDREDGWRAMKVAGVLDFSLIGIIAQLSAALAEAKVSVFVVSTFDTDYLLVKEDKLSEACDALRATGCAIEGI